MNKYKNWKNFLKAKNLTLKDNGWRIEVRVDEKFSKYAGKEIYRCEARKGDEMKGYSVFAVGILDVKLLTEDELIDRIDSTCHRILCGYYEEHS